MLAGHLSPGLSHHPTWLSGSPLSFKFSPTHLCKCGRFGSSRTSSLAVPPGRASTIWSCFIWPIEDSSQREERHHAYSEEEREDTDAPWPGLPAQAVLAPVGRSWDPVPRPGPIVLGRDWPGLPLLFSTRSARLGQTCGLPPCSPELTTYSHFCCS